MPEQAPPPPPVEGGTHVVQLLRTYPNLRHGRDYPFARGGERSVARGYTKAVSKARRLIYVEDQYLWGHHVGDVFTQALKDHPDLHVDRRRPAGPGPRRGVRPHAAAARPAPRDAGHDEVAPDRVAVYGIENHAGTPVYVHAKACVVDDTWATIGSDNFNRRSWTHDSELSAVVVDEAGDYARDLRLTLAAEHLDRAPRRRGRLRRPGAACSRRTPRARPRWTPGTRAVGSGRGRRDGSVGWSRRSWGSSSARSRRRRTSCSTTRTAAPGRCGSATTSRDTSLGGTWSLRSDDAELSRWSMSVESVSGLASKRTFTTWLPRSVELRRAESELLTAILLGAGRR